MIIVGNSKLYANVCAGVELRQFQPSDIDMYSPLLYFEGDTNITVTASHFDNINATNMSALPQPLMLFSTIGSVIVSGLSSSNCTLVEGALFQFNLSSPASVSLSNSTFSNTFTALAVQHSSIIMTDTAFDHVTQTTIITRSGTVVDIQNCSFSNGGLLYISAPNVTINHSQFHNNYAGTDGSTPENPPGGAISITSQIWDPDDASYFSGTYLISDCLFMNNSATSIGPALGTNGAGGAVMVDGSQGSATEHLTVQNCTFIGNSAVVGGALSTWGVAYVVISGCSFTHNMASASNGAAVYVYGLELKLTSVFMENSVVSQSTYSTPSADNCDVVFESCSCAGASSSQFVDSLGTGLCIVDVEGGQCAVDALPSGSLSFAFGAYDITTDTNNELDTFLGDVDTVVNAIVVDVRDCIFSNHTCTSQPSLDPFLGGAGLHIESASVTVLTRLMFTDNYARQGAGLHVKACDTTLLWNSSFLNNTATHEGGAVALVDTGEAGLLIGVTNMTNCTALTGGAVYGGPGTAIAITNGSILSGNRAVTNGGAVYCNGCQTFAMRDSTSVTANEARQSGGGCYFDMTLLIVVEDSLLNNNW